MKILITGCAGFIGFHLSLKLSRNKNYKIFGIDNIDNYYDKNLKLDRLNIIKKNKNFHFTKLNINNKSKLNKYFKKNNFDIVIHLAAQAGVRLSLTNPRKYFDNNISGFFNIIELSRLINVKKFIFASSSSVYGDSKLFPSKENQYNENQKSFYAFSKKINEEISISYSNTYDMNISAIRFFTVYGPYGRPDMLFFNLVNSILNKKQFNIYNNGKHFRDFTYIDDAINILTKIIFNSNNNKNKFNIYNIGSGKSYSLLFVVQLVEKILNKKANIKLINKQEGDVIKTHADLSLIRRKFKYKNKNHLSKGIKKYIDWFKYYYL
tara:strand:- start:711 stop:1676 length:966 start_codon:yes stop_codon:yes gene_type:complete